jgi:spore germination protein YaaH
MTAKATIWVSVFVSLPVLAAGIFLCMSRPKPVIVKTMPSDILPTEDPRDARSALSVSGWLPYWKKVDGIASLEGKMNLFSEINPFAFDVAPDGSLIDTMHISDAPWTMFREEAEKENVDVIPTILWTDASSMHRVFTDPALLMRHVDAIASMLERNGFSGVDIDYEGKDVADRDAFTGFLSALHVRLSGAGKTVSCTIEARTADAPPAGWGGTRAMAYANDFSALNDSCDTVRVMAYDEVFQVRGDHRSFESADTVPAAPNADIVWVESVMRYALRYIAPEKLMLGVPTYGWEFKLTELAKGYHYERVRSLDYPDAIAEAKVAGVTPMRTSGGELSFMYAAPDGNHLVTFDDAESVRKKITLAKNLHLKGVSLFKLDGGTDLELFSVIGKEVGRGN